nr:MAG TPA: hypothetical protein [Caudoviricetes sp.]DAY45051.1 MAG TPA: hypothetical protein [Caudoviricetes sp.]
MQLLKKTIKAIIYNSFNSLHFTLYFSNITFF